MMNIIKRWKIKKTRKSTNASIDYFPRANISDVKHYTKPPTKKTPNAEIVIIHTGTNYLSRYSTPTDIVILSFLKLFQEVSNYKRKH